MVEIGVDIHMYIDELYSCKFYAVQVHASTINSNIYMWMRVPVCVYICVYVRMLCVYALFCIYMQYACVCVRERVYANI